MRALAVAVCLIVACTTPPPALPTPGRSPEPGVLTVTALLDLSGTRASAGTQQRNALQMWTEQQRRGGTPMKLDIIDVAGSDAKLLIELRRAATDALTDALIVGTPVAFDVTVGRAVEVAALPVLLLQPINGDPAGRPGGHWAFALAPSLERLASSQIDDAVRRGVLAPSVVLTDGRERIDPMAAAIAADLERRRLEPLTRIPIGTDGLPPVVRSSLSVLRSVHCLAPMSACSALAREARAAGSSVMVYLPYLTSPADHVKDDRDLAARAIWPSSRTLIPSPVLRTEEEHARAEFVKRFGERHGAWPGTHAASAYDALSLLAAAADRGGADDRAGLRDTLERITMPLIASTYAFTAERHAGSEPTDLTYMRWDANGPAIAPVFGTVAPTPSPSPAPLRTASPSPSASASPSASP